MPRLSISGSRFVTPDGQTVILRGANTMRGEYDHTNNGVSIEESLISHLKGDFLGNVIHRGFATDPVNSNSSFYLAMLDRIVARCKQQGVYCVLSPRSLTVNGKQYPGIPPQSAIDALAKLGARYKDETHVMYTGQVETNNSGGYEPTWLEIRDYTERVVDAIRNAAGWSIIVMSSGRDYGRDVNGAVANPVRRPNVAYKSHCYGPTTTVYNGPNGWTYRGWNEPNKDAINAGLCVFVGEYAVEPNVLMAQSDVDNLQAYMLQKGLSCTAWLMDPQTAENLVTGFGPFATQDPRGVAVRTWMRANTPAIPNPLA